MRNVPPVCKWTFFDFIIIIFIISSSIYLPVNNAQKCNVHSFTSSSIEMVITRSDNWMHISEVEEKIEC